MSQIYPDPPPPQIVIFHIFFLLRMSPSYDKISSFFVAGWMLLELVGGEEGGC